MRTVAEIPHLVRRFVDGLRSGAPSAEDERWARTVAGPGADLWSAQADRDRRHTLAVARAVDGPTTPSWVLRAALLHDVGKTLAAIGVFGRACATVLELLRISSVPGRLGRYLDYPVLGAQLLAEAGLESEVVRWAAEHHAPPRAWTVPVTWAERLAAADRSAR